MAIPNQRDNAKFEKKMDSFNKASEKLAISSLSANLNVLISTARRVSASLIRDYNELENLQTSMRAPEKFLATAQSFCEDKMQQALNKARPTFGFVFENKPEVVGEDTSHRFICSGLNGKINFSHAIPFFCLSIAIERNREIINSVIYNPITDELFYAEKGNGAFMMSGRGNIRLRASGRKDINTAIMSCSDPSKAQGVHTRSLGCTALEMAYVAAGKLDACWAFDVNTCDIAAGMLLVKEAAGVVRPVEKSAIKDKEILDAKNIFAGTTTVTEQFKI